MIVRSLTISAGFACWNIDHRPGYEADAPDLNLYIRLMDMLRASVRLDVQEGRPDDAARGVDRIFRLAEIARGEPVFGIWFWVFSGVGSGAIREAVGSCCGAKRARRMQRRTISLPIPSCDGK